MTIQVIGQNFEVGESLTEHVKSTISKKIEKYNQNLISANITFTEAPHKKVKSSVKVELKLSDFFATAEENDAYSAFNSAFVDVEKQITRELEKMKSHK
ncbi:ribosome-associated translation inhibitor RaiA [bacterium]|nr:ribosome-associated translation inhibitor RaiA [bacterium]